MRYATNHLKGLGILGTFLLRVDAFHPAAMLLGVGAVRMI